MGGDNGYGDPEPQFFTWDSYTGITRALKTLLPGPPLAKRGQFGVFSKLPR